MILGVAIALSVAASVNAQPRREFTLESEIDTYPLWRSRPSWNAGLLVWCEHNQTDGPIVYTVDKDGRRDEFLLAFPNTKRIGVNDLAVGPNGEIVIAAGAATPDGRGMAFFARLPADRGDWKVTQTWPYNPWRVTMTSRGDVWTVGWLLDDENVHMVAQCVLRRYDPSGNLLTSQRLAARRGPEPYTVHLDDSLFSSHDRVGWFIAGGDYTEFSLDGDEIGRYKGPPGLRSPDGVAISADNDVILSAGRGRFLILDRSSGEWTRAFLPDGQAPSWARVLGFDGTTLVTTTGTGKLTRYTTK